MGKKTLNDIGSFFKTVGEADAGRLLDGFSMDGLLQGVDKVASVFETISSSGALDAQLPGFDEGVTASSLLGLDSAIADKIAKPLRTFLDGFKAKGEPVDAFGLATFLESLGSVTGEKGESGYRAVDVHHVTGGWYDNLQAFEYNMKLELGFEDKFASNEIELEEEGVKTVPVLSNPTSPPSPSTPAEQVDDSGYEWFTHTDGSKWYRVAKSESAWLKFE